jgi:hypothetical protein
MCCFFRVSQANGEIRDPEECQEEEKNIFVTNGAKSAFLCGVRSLVSVSKHTAIECLKFPASLKASSSYSLSRFARHQASPDFRVAKTHPTQVRQAYVRGIFPNRNRLPDLLSARACRLSARVELVGAMAAWPALLRVILKPAHTLEALRSQNISG